MNSKFNDSAKSLASWKSYEYIGPGDKFNPVHYEERGGAGNKPYIWADDTMWSIDIPEDPPSILALLYYRYWSNEAPVDLRNSTVKFHLRGDHLDLKGAQCFFWVSIVAPTTTRWHYIDQPIEITDGCWGGPIKLTLRNDPDLWHRSFSADSYRASSLNQSLSASISYGISFVGFTGKVTGKLSLSSFVLISKVDSSWPYSANFQKKAHNWQTVSRLHGKQMMMSRGYVGENQGNGYTRQRQMACIKDDFLRIKNYVPFTYLAFIHSKLSTQGRDLSNSLLIVSQREHKLDLKGGRIVFFVEHSASSTIWAYRQPFIGHDSCVVLKRENSFWHRLTGKASLESILSGNSGEKGYDYLGLMVVNVNDNPSGIWGLYHFSIGPNIEDE